jgi:hypothetical protein
VSYIVLFLLIWNRCLACGFPGVGSRPAAFSAAGWRCASMGFVRAFAALRTGDHHQHPRPAAQRLVADDETVIDIPAKLSARARVFATGQGRKTEPIDVHIVAVADRRTAGLCRVAADDATVALRLLVDRRDAWAAHAPTPSPR